MIGLVPPPDNWTPDLCAKCPVPGILQANACPNMELRGSVKRTWLGLVRNVQVTAFCTKSQQFVEEPHIGCGQCHPLPPEFLENTK